MNIEEVIYQDSGIVLNGEKLYKRVVLEKRITITESQFDEAYMKAFRPEQPMCEHIEVMKQKLGF